MFPLTAAAWANRLLACWKAPAYVVPARADCARDVRAGEDEPVGALALQLRQAAPSRAAQHSLQVPHRQTFGRLRINGRLALHAGPCRIRER